MFFTPILFVALSGPPACAPNCAIEVPACAIVARREVTRTVVRVERAPRRCRSCEPQAPAACAKVEVCAPVAACARVAKTRTVVRGDRPHVVAKVAVAILPPYRHKEGCDCK